MKTFILFLLIIVYCHSTVIPEKYLKYLRKLGYLAEQYRENCFNNEVFDDDDSSESDVSWNPGEIEYLENLALSLLSDHHSHEFENLDSDEGENELTSGENFESEEKLKANKKEDKNKDESDQQSGEENHKDHSDEEETDKNKNEKSEKKKKQKDSGETEEKYDSNESS